MWSGDAGRFFASPTVQATPAVSSATPTIPPGSTPSAPSLARLLPAHSLLKQRYLILIRLDQSGMGAVYHAADIQLGNRLMAVGVSPSADGPCLAACLIP
ncbi:MAG: hypothetical protein J2P37_11645 [Ktedonobacteraceae bacterium]|nr:hypothetical protein [Ktedonobacteraceae bacterium]